MAEHQGWASSLYAAERAAAAYRYAAAVLGPGRDAEESAQEALGKIWLAGDRRPERGPSYLEPATFRAIVVRTALTRWDRRRREAGAAAGEPAPRAARRTPRLDWLDIWDAVERLSAIRRQVILLTLGGHDDQEISGILGTTPGAVRNARFHARRALREELA